MATVDVSEKTSPAEQNQRGARPRRQPQYQVILWNDDDHTYEYVINMLRAVFGFPLEKGYQMAHTVDQTGRVVCLVTTREHAELKQQQIHSFGKDYKIPLCSGAMWATIEPLGN
ncbi:MAG: ATP-dependent Clp protease adaptor ClpS [Planctomycetota bacterium]|nr:ATP-dependent Clp protease adaptor ClpS [Planctomycetota bacterium]MDA1178156.1 ATP-dependent Clp protease adaptor ClpS [Planctomycetota bacterium]